MAHQLHDNMYEMDRSIVTSTERGEPTDDETGNPLSEANLAQNDAISSQEDRYAESQIRQEGMQLYERELHAVRCNPAKRPQQDNSDIVEEARELQTSLQSISRQYRSPSSASTKVLERFSFVSPQNDPTPLQARNAMFTMNVTEGSLEGVKSRGDAARITAANVEVPSDSDSTNAVTSQASDQEELVADSDAEDAVEDDSVSYRRPVAAALVSGTSRVQRLQSRIRRDADSPERKRRRVA